MKFLRNLIYLNQDFSDRKDMFTYIGTELINLGLVKPEYIEKILEREENFPTGIDLGYMQVAMPHVESQYVNDNAIFIVTSKKGVEFENAEDDGIVNAKIIFGLIVKNSEEHIDFLMKLTVLFQKEEVLKDIYNLNDQDKVIEILKENLN